MEILESKYIEKEADIESFFKDNGYDYFDCGQGYYQDESTIPLKIGEEYYWVKLCAKISGSKQDVGDELYWVENIESVTWSKTNRSNIIEKLNASVMETIAQLEQQIDDLKSKLV